MDQDINKQLTALRTRVAELEAELKEWHSGLGGVVGAWQSATGCSTPEEAAEIIQVMTEKLNQIDEAMKEPR